MHEMILPFLTAMKYPAAILSVCAQYFTHGFTCRFLNKMSGSLTGPAQISKDGRSYSTVTLSRLSPTRVGVSSVATSAMVSSR